MKPLPSFAELLDIVYRHYPRGLSYAEPAYDESPEYRRLLAARDARMKDSRWPRLIETLERRFPEASIEDGNIPGYDAGFRCRMTFPERDSSGPFTVAGLVSQLAPIYMVYVLYLDPPEVPRNLRRPLLFVPTGPAEPYARALAEEIERTFAYAPLPVDWAMTPVPDVAMSEAGLGEARLIHCLLTSDSWWLEP